MRENLGASKVCDFPVAQMVKIPPAMQETWVLFLGQEDPLEKEVSFLLSVFPIRVFSSESVLHIKWPKYWTFSFSISPSSEYSGLISFRMGWFDLLAVQGTL